jgi:hypothetical protein
LFFDTWSDCLHEEPVPTEDSITQTLTCVHMYLAGFKSTIPASKRSNHTNMAFTPKKSESIYIKSGNCKYQVQLNEGCNINQMGITIGSQCSSVSIVFDYGLDDRAIGVQSPADAKDFSCNLCVQSSSEADPAFCPMGTGSPFPGVKRGRGVTLPLIPIYCQSQE